MDNLIARLSEPSTYAGFSGLALTYGVSQPLYHSVSLVIAGLFGVAAIVMKEKQGAAS